MHFLTILTTLSATFGATIAADICRPTSSDCGGTAVCCLGIQENNCCNLGGSSTRIRFKLPANSRGQGFSNTGCTGNVGTIQNPNARTVCVSYGSGRQSGKWLTGLASRIKRDEEVDGCAEPNAVLRVRDGVTTRVDLRDGVTAEDALAARDEDAVDAGDFGTASHVEEYVTADE